MIHRIVIMPSNVAESAVEPFEAAIFLVIYWMDCVAGLEIGGLSLYVDINKGLKKLKNGIKP